MRMALFVVFIVASVSLSSSLSGCGSTDAPAEAAPTDSSPSTTPSSPAASPTSIPAPTPSTTDSPGTASAAWSQLYFQHSSDYIEPNQCDYPHRFTLYSDGRFSAGPCFAGQTETRTGTLNTEELNELQTRVTALNPSAIPTEASCNTQQIAFAESFLDLSPTENNPLRIYRESADGICYRGNPANVDPAYTYANILKTKDYPTPSPQACTQVFVYGVSITATNSSGASITNATATLQEGSYSEIMENRQDGTYVGAGERAGDYTLTVQAPGYQLHQQNISVTKDSCHVLPENRSIRLTPQ